MKPALQHILFLALGFTGSLFVTSLPSLSLDSREVRISTSKQVTKKTSKKYSLQVYIVIDISLLLQDKSQQTRKETAQSVTESL